MICDDVELSLLASVVVVVLHLNIVQKNVLCGSSRVAGVVRSLLAPEEPCAFFRQGTLGKCRQAAVHEPTGVKRGGLSDE